MRGIASAIMLMMAVVMMGERVRGQIAGLTGVHFDIEPHVLDEWDTDWESVGQQFLPLLESLRAIVSPAELQLTLDMNADLDGPQCSPGGDCTMTYDGKTKQLSSHIIDRLDRVVLMAYFPDGAAMVEHTSGEVPYASSTSKEALIGANLSPNGPDSETFYPSVSDMETAFAVVRDSYGEQSSFSKFAIHHYGYYTALGPDAQDHVLSREIYWWCGSEVELCNIYDSTDRDTLLAFCLDHDITTVYIDAPAIVNLAATLDSCSQDVALLVTFIERLHDNGINSELIFGRHEWALTENHHVPEQYARDVVTMIALCSDFVAPPSTPSSDDSDHNAASTLKPFYF